MSGPTAVAMVSLDVISSQSEFFPKNAATFLSWLFSRGQQKYSIRVQNSLLCFNTTIVKSLDGPRGYTYVQKQRLGMVYFLVTHFGSSEWSLLQNLRKIIWIDEHWQLWCDAGLLQVMRTEILLVLIADCAIFAIYPDTIASVGYAIVLACSFGLILAPKIEDKLCPTKASMPKEISGPPRENEAYVKEA